MMGYKVVEGGTNGHCPTARNSSGAFPAFILIRSPIQLSTTQQLPMFYIPRLPSQQKTKTKKKTKKNINFFGFSWLFLIRFHLIRDETISWWKSPSVWSHIDLRALPALNRNCFLNDNENRSFRAPSFYAFFGYYSIITLYNPNSRYLFD